MNLPSAWRGWRTHLLSPLLGAVLGRGPGSDALVRDAERFPDALVSSEQAADKARALGVKVDSGWASRQRLAAALDRQDNFSRLLRRPLSTAARLTVKGTWPKEPFVALGLHWGAGFPVLDHLLRSGRQPAFVYRPENPATFDRVPQRLQDRLHLRALNSFGNCIRVGGAYRKITAALSEGHVPVALIDAPVAGKAQTLTVDCEQFRITLRSGMFRLLAEHKVPMVWFRCGQAVSASARPTARLLQISPLFHADSAEVIAQEAASFLLDTLQHDAAQWHLWPVAGQLIEFRSSNSGLKVE